MPLGFQRLNERVSRPNPHINFIKPLPGPAQAVAQDYLERIAAQCYPVMRANHVYVMALEEYAPNPEFAGRNFNAGEVIQLVLKARNGSWLPFRHVQMVMMHELAHCNQMNHSGAFWKVRNAYAAEMRELWAKGYTGEGLWGRGRTLDSGAFMRSQMPDASTLPAHICGGTYRRSRRRKRKRGPAEAGQLSYAERKQRRILKKFGAGGIALGTDEEERVKLENGKKAKGKPRVAGSARGRELRAAAALARFEKVKEEHIKQEESGSETESDDEWPASDEEPAVDSNGKTLVDSRGNGLVKVCDGDNEHDENTKLEMQELLEVERAGDNVRRSSPKTQRLDEGSTTEDDDIKSNPAQAYKPTKHKEKSHPRRTTVASPTLTPDASTHPPSDRPPDDVLHEQPPGKPCPACSYDNDPDSSTCLVCANVLDPTRMANHWRCLSLACRGGAYINIGDYGRCQICGAAKPDATTREKGGTLDGFVS